MSDLYLIAHKVRGEAAFDVAERMRCPVCEPIMQGLDHGSAPNTCSECDGEGFWWIIPTSGHRAHPYWFTELKIWNSLLSLCDQSNWPDMKSEEFTGYTAAMDEIHQLANDLIPCPMPIDWPDHYPLKKSSPALKFDNAIAGNNLLAKLGLLKPIAPFKRRV